MAETESICYFLPVADETLTTPLLRMAYAQGYFPMPHPNTGEIAWYRPDPRAIIPLDGFRCSRSLERTLRRGHFRITFDQTFSGVMQGCAEREETWITSEFFTAYIQLHKEGFAHSVEVWNNDLLVGGVYGVCLGGAFFAESKFHRETDASKVALFHLVKRLNERGFTLLETQFWTEHLGSLGAIAISDGEYQARLKQALMLKPKFI